ncbi:MAG: hypothetical protein RIR08_802 [Pseudomonadota bacterium]
MKAINPDQQYLSTRQSAKILQVSLGTVQKMVEEGDLVAWKTRGGHRRILATSLNQQLRRRKLGLQESASKQQYLALGIFRRPENLVQMRSAIESWSLRLDLVGSIDSLEGLMQAVSLYPDVIYLDSLIPPVEQLHLIHYLSKNIQTRRIPMLVDEAFVQLHPGGARYGPRKYSTTKASGVRGANHQRSTKSTSREIYCICILRR